MEEYEGGREAVVRRGYSFELVAYTGLFCLLLGLVLGYCFGGGKRVVVEVAAPASRNEEEVSQTVAHRNGARPGTAGILRVSGLGVTTRAPAVV